MAIARHEPADIRSMGIIDSALRRDLERTRMALTHQPCPDPEQRRTLASPLDEDARAYRDDDSARKRLLEMMPVAAATLTDAEYRAVEHEHLVAPKGLWELGVEAHWVLDGLLQNGRDVILCYRRAATRRWGTGAVARVPSLHVSMAREGS